MGNAVNLAARLEGANKSYGTWILAPEITLQQTEGRLLSRRIDRIRVVGINEPIQILITTKSGTGKRLRKVSGRLYH
jgi:adenylate cyclase